jgi:anthranilate phosphoribosyltransferase
MKETLELLIRGEGFSRAEAKMALHLMVTQELPASQIGAFLSLLRTRVLSVDELTGFRDALFDLRIPLSLKGENLIDVCGTGGDGKGTFNISTLTGFVLAGAGFQVAKHGNASQSSACGSSDVLAVLGNRFFVESEKLQKCIDEAGICYLHAPLFQPALKSVGKVRKELKIRTVFNVLGPLLNPASPQCQLLGVASKDLMRLYGYFFEKNKTDFFVVMSSDCYDEISLTAPFFVYSKEGETLYHPEELGFTIHSPESLEGGGTVESYARIFQQVLEGKGTPAQREVVVANAAFAMKLVRSDLDIRECIQRAQESLDSQRALQSYQTFHKICLRRED